MTSISETHVEQIVAACRDNVAGIAESLNRCFGRNVRIEIGEASPWTADEALADLNGPGLAVAFQIGEEGMLCLLPAALPLPDWYADPDDDQKTRLETLPLEWSVNMLPSDLDAEQFGATAWENLRQCVVDAEPADHATVLKLTLHESGPKLASEPQGDSSQPDSEAADDSSAESAEPAEEATAADEATTAEEPPPASDKPSAKFYLVVPVARPPLPADVAGSTGGTGSSYGSDGGGSFPRTGGDPSQPVDAQLLGLPVTVSVRLAEKKIELGQLISLTPGGLIIFNKSCENLLDLYVNNLPFCRGEAIKIGEKFGLKISQIGVEPERDRRDR